jgi:hypothetical protein
MYLGWWNPLRCVRIPHHCVYVGYEGTKPTTCDCHFIQKNMTKEKFQVMTFKKEALKLLIIGSPMAFQHTYMFPKILLHFSSSLERHRRPCILHGNLFEMLIPSLEHLFSTHDAQLVLKSSCTMECSFAFSIWETLYACPRSPYWQFGLFRQRTWFQQFE